MEKITYNGGTHNLAETIIDFKNGSSEIKGVAPPTLFNRLTSAFHDWVGWISLPYSFIILIVNQYLNWDVIIYVCIWIILMAFVLSLHINKKWDKYWKVFFARRTGRGERNKAVFNNFKSKELIIYNIRNMVVEFDTNGDVKNKLSKIWIKNEDPISQLSNQAPIKSMNLLNKTPIWNCYFIFEDIPKDGELYVEWI